jgi:tRNA U54 and U55 pseudouridine synthase Pus10
MQTARNWKTHWIIINGSLMKWKRKLKENENENTTYQNIWNTAKAVLKVYSHEWIYQKDRMISNQWANGTSQTPRKTRTRKSKINRRREIINMSWNQWNRNRKKIQSINETKSLFFEKINKINRTLENLIKMRREKT